MKMMSAIRGLVRPLVTVVFSVVFCWGFMGGLVPGEAFVTAVTMILAFWFGSRTPTAD